MLEAGMNGHGDDLEFVGVLMLRGVIVSYRKFRW